jgi:hypothetical protein
VLALAQAVEHALGHGRVEQVLAGPDGPDGPDQLVAADLGEADVHHDHVGQGLGGHGHGFAGRARLGAHDHVLGVGQQQLDAVADDLVVVDQHDPQGVWLKTIAWPSRSRKSLRVASATRCSSTWSTARPTTPSGGR